MKCILYLLGMIAMQKKGNIKVILDLFFLIMCGSVFYLHYVRAPHTCLLPTEVRRQCTITLNCSYGWL